MSTITIKRPVPATVTKFQAKAALLLDGQLQAVEDLVAQSDAMTQLAWREADFSRSSPMIASMASILEWDNEYLDDLFRRAARIVV